MYNDEYNDAHYLINLINEHVKKEPIVINQNLINQNIINQNIINQSTEIVKERTNSLLLTEEFNAKLYNTTRKSIDITNLSIMKDDIKNYRPLTDIQLKQIEDLTEAEKIEIIKTYNIMFASIENLII